MDGKKSIWLRNAGYTLTEAMTVVGCIGIVAAFAVPNMIRFKATMEVQDATAQVGGALQRTRARAASEGIPFLFLVQPEDVVDGARSPFAQIVRDNDRSYSVTAPDDVEEFTLEADLSPDVRQYGVGPDATTSDIPRAYGDATDLYSASAFLLVETHPVSASGGSGSGSSGSGSGSSGSGSGSSGSGSGSSGSGSSGSGTQSGSSSESLSEAVMNGSTLPVSDAAGVPAIAFNERGIPVALDTPTDWGTGAGAIYLTDNGSAVFACVLSPLGEVSITRYDAGSGSWR